MQDTVEGEKEEDITHTLIEQDTLLIYTMIDMSIKHSTYIRIHGDDDDDDDDYDEK